MNPLLFQSKLAAANIAGQRIACQRIACQWGGDTGTAREHHDVQVQVGLGVLYLPIGGHTIGSKAVRQHVQIDPIILDH